jgi:hypothetical protein
MTTDTPVLDTAANLIARVSAAQSTIAAANLRYQEARAVADECLSKESRPSQELLTELKNRFKDSAVRLAESKSVCPVFSHGGFREPSDVHLDEEGLTLEWDVNANYAPVFFCATWAELLAA